MTQWRQVSQHLSSMPNHTIMGLYPEIFPIEVRYYLQEWIEEQRWEEMNDSKESENLAQQLQQHMLVLLQNVPLQIPNSMEHIKIQHICKKMSAVQPLRLAMTIRDVLREERHWLEQAKINQYSVVPMTVNDTVQKMPEIDTGGLNTLMQKVLEIQSYRQQIHQFQEEVNCEVDRADLIKFEQKKVKIQEYAKSRIEVLQETVCLLDQCQIKLLYHIDAWCWSQLRSTIGWVFNEDLSFLQTWCEQILDVNGNLRQELTLVIRDHGIIKEFQQMEEKLNVLLKNLIQNSLVVEKQPPQVIKTQSKFTSTVRYLLGEKLGTGKPVHLKAQIITEAQARTLAQGPILPENVGDLINSNALLERNTTNKYAFATFRNMSIKKIKRADRKGSESVTEEKFAIVFTTELIIAGCEISYTVQVISAPVVVIVHGSQENNAMATIIWDCAFCEAKRIPFIVPEKVSWHQMCEALCQKFMFEVQTSKALDNCNLQCLAQKIFDRPNISENWTNLHVSWSQFNKEVLPGRTFTFWQWFEGVIELTKKCLKAYWTDGLIFGFIGKQHLHVILQEQPSGTFLLRFSDSELGGITIAYVCQNENGGRRIQNIQPFTKKDLDSVCLGDRIRDISCITQLYQADLFNCPHKNEAFKKYFTAAPTPLPDGYLPFKLTTVVEPEHIQPQPQPQPNFLPPQFPNFGTQYQQNTEGIYPEIYNHPQMLADESNNMELEEILKTLTPKL